MKSPAHLRLLATLAALTVGSVFTARAAEPIKIGEYASLTGKEAGFGQTSHHGVALAVEEINAAGGVLGRKLELVTEDNQTKSGESATVVKKLISRDKVIALIGEVSSGRSNEAAPIAQAAKIPMIAPAATNPTVTQKGNYIFRVCFIDPFQGTVLAKFARNDLKVKRVAVLSSVSNAYSLGLAKFFKETFIPAGGVIVTEKNFSEGDKDFRAQLTAVKAANVEAVFVPSYYTEAPGPRPRHHRPLPRRRRLGRRTAPLHRRRGPQRLLLLHPLLRRKHRRRRRQVRLQI